MPQHLRVTLLTLLGAWVMALIFTPAAAKADQKVFLDFVGGTAPPANSSATAGAGGKKAFVNSPSVTKFIQAGNPAFDTAAEVATKIMDDIKTQMEADYKGLWVSFTKTKPVAGNFSSLDFANNVSIGAGVLGTVDTDQKAAGGGVLQIDTGNTNKSDNAWILADEFTLARAGGNTLTQAQITNEMANVASHEMAHLLGIVHADGTAASIMGTVAGITYDGSDKGFTDGTKAKLAGVVGLDVNGKHVTIKELLNALSGLVSVVTATVNDVLTESFTLDYTPGLTGPVGGSILLQGPNDSNPNDFVTPVVGGTVTGSGLTGLHGDLFGVNDPFGNFTLILPDQVEIIAINGFTNAPIFNDFVVEVIDNNSSQQIMVLDVAGLTFDPHATVVVLPGLTASDTTSDDPIGSPDPAALPLVEELPALIGTAFPAFINPAALGLGSYLDTIDALLSGIDFSSEFLITTNLADVTNGFFSPGSTNENAAAFRIVPEAFNIPGDFDHDSDVDGTDFLKWQRGESPNPLSPLELADWELNFGSSSLVGTTTIPEPNTLLLGALAAVGLLLWRR